LTTLLKILTSPGFSNLIKREIICGIRCGYLRDSNTKTKVYHKMESNIVEIFHEKFPIKFYEDESPINSHDYNRVL